MKRLGFVLLALILIGGLALALCLLSTPACAQAAVSSVEGSPIRPTEAITTHVYLPFVSRFGPCEPIPGESYGVLWVVGDPTDRPAHAHADLNLGLRGYVLADAFEGLVDDGSPTDPVGPPQLYGLFADNRTATFSNVYQVRHWDWGCNCRGPAITDPEVTLAGLEVTPGETIHVPDSGYDVGEGYEVLILYASTSRITLKYTREDNVVNGYTIHVEDVCVEPNLLALYQTWNEAGRSSLPALRPGQALGRAIGSEIKVAVRDTGRFMDPRVRKDWWQGR